MTPPDWLVATAGGWILSLHAQPGAKRTQVQGEHGGALKIRLAAPPVDGKANEALLTFLADRLRLPRRQLTLTAGASARSKRVLVADARPASAIVLALLPPVSPEG